MTDPRDRLRIGSWNRCRFLEIGELIDDTGVIWRDAKPVPQEGLMGGVDEGLIPDVASQIKIQQPKLPFECPSHVN